MTAAQTGEFLDTYPVTQMKKVLLASTLAIGLSATSCLGPDNAYNSLKNWNAQMSEQDWLNEVVFIGMVIIPVYPIALLGDIVIFNTIDYWSGGSTIANPGPFPGFGSQGKDAADDE